MKLKNRKRIIFILLFVTLNYYVNAQLKLFDLFTSNMVLQQNVDNIVNGTTKPNALVTIRFLNKTYSAKANKKGEWQITLKAAPAHEGSLLTIKSHLDSIVLQNVAIGEVWLCSGQSNMEFTMSSFKEFYKEEIAHSANSNIRYATITKQYDKNVRNDVQLNKPWQAIDENSILDCSAVAYFFANNVNKQINKPVGLIISSWGGTPAQSWMSESALQPFRIYDSVYKNIVKKIDFDQIEKNKRSFQTHYEKTKIKTVQLFKKVITQNAQWSKTKLPGNWEENGYPNFDGIAAYRIKFTLSKEDANKDAVLHLPAIDDIDSTFVNNIFVGSKAVWNELRIYTIPKNCLVSGENDITIWVEDTGGGGGLNNDEENFYLEIGDQKIALKGDASFIKLLDAASIPAQFKIQNIHYQPAVLYNAMIHPLTNISVRGAIWYQGESNAGAYKEYEKLFPALIQDWRKAFKKELPFYFVQLSSFNPNVVEPETSNWAGLRNAQSLALQLPNTGMAVSYDVGDQKDIHPKQKKEVGERLALHALYNLYGFKNLIHKGPMFKKALPQNQSIKIEFDVFGSSLVTNGNMLQGFEVAGENKKFEKANAIIVQNEVIVSSAKVTKPVYVRYAWAEAPLEANLFNKAGLPAVPFNTAFQ